MTNQEILADILIGAREDNGYSLRQLAHLTGVSHSEISKLEKAMRKNPNPRILKKLTDKLNLNYEEVLEAVGYIKSDYSFEDKTNVLREEEKEYIVNAITTSWDNNVNTDINFTDKQEIYNVLFGKTKIKTESLDITKHFPKLSMLLRNNIDLLQEPKHKKKLYELIKWYIDLIGDEE